MGEPTYRPYTMPPIEVGMTREMVFFLVLEALQNRLGSRVSRDQSERPLYSHLEFCNRTTFDHLKPDY